jgi:hypothetical protein
MVELLLFAWLIILAVLIIKTSLSTILKLGLYLTLASIIISILY